MSERAVIIDCGSGNLRSVEKALERAARENGLAIHFDIVDDPALVAAADRVILPGVGAFGACMAAITGNDGMLEALEHVVLIAGKPFLGVCVGMQVLSEYGHEFGRTEGLGWIPGEVRKMAASPARRVPHMGWNTVNVVGGGSVLSGVDGEDFYFLHSYHFVVENSVHCAGVCQYEEDLVAAVMRDNILGVQFHPEKSQHAGAAMLGEFLRWRP
ncbi:MAG: imidazole glycerol phosphate synthase subunit HisH [Parvularculaceae bacterium]